MARHSGSVDVRPIELEYAINDQLSRLERSDEPTGHQHDDRRRNADSSGFSNHSIDLHYDYSVVNAHDTNTDSARQTGTAAYIVPLNTKDRVQLNLSVGDIKYSSSQSADYISQSANLQYVRVGDSIEFDGRIGYTVFDQKQHADNVGGTTGNAKLTWLVSDATSVYASYARSIQDQSANLTTGIPTFGQTVTDNTNVTTPYTLDETSIGVSTKLGHNTVGLTGYIDDQKYENSTQVNQPVQADQNTKGVTLSIGRSLWPTLEGHIYANYSKVDYSKVDLIPSSNQDTYDTGLRLDWTRWRNLTVFVGTTYTKRTSDVATEEYNEWVGTIGLTYTLIGPRK